MKRSVFAALMAFATVLSALAEALKLVGVGDTRQEEIIKNEIAGTITVVVTKDKTVHWETTGLANAATERPVAPGALFLDRHHDQTRQHTMRFPARSAGTSASDLTDKIIVRSLSRMAV